jgi:MFS transporter, DHA1 family, multidrug resistance protein
MDDLSLRLINRRKWGGHCRCLNSKVHNSKLAITNWLPHSAAMNTPNTPKRAELGDKEFVTMMAILMALNALAIDTMLPAFPAMAAGLGVAGGNAIQYVVSAYLIGTGVGSLIFGPLTDRYGRRPVLFAALIGYMIFALICGKTSSFELFVAMRFTHGLCGAGLGVVATAVVRDKFAGDAMAKRMSLIFLIFMVVPVIAPTIGQIILWFAGWRAIYYLFAGSATLVLIWVYLRLPETLDALNITPLNVPTMLRSWRAVIVHRSALAYMAAGGMIQGAMFGFLNSSQQIFERVFDATDIFAYCFAVVALGMAAANFTNARIVERFGARRVSQTATIVFIFMSLSQFAASLLAPDSLPIFIAMLTLNMGLAGFIGSNFGSIAMNPFGTIAGTASSFQGFARTIIAGGVGAFIGQTFDKSVAPIIFGFLLCGVSALLLILWGEGGKLFTRPGTTRHIPM